MSRREDDAVTGGDAGLGAGVDGEVAAEVREFCRRVLGPGPQARDAAASALEGAPPRIVALGRAARECRARADHPGGVDASSSVTAQQDPASEPGSLAEAVAAEVAAANRALPERQREVLALRELLRLSYEQIGLALGIDAAAVGALIARARLLLRAELRGSDAAAAACAERERALRVLARRQDSESLDAEDDDWIRAHLGECLACEQAHAAMLEASVRYRAWRSGG
jgi:hypothetical protein